jgi:hypothetical protein
MATGKIKDLFPDGNDGSIDGGAGRVTDDATGKDYVFLTVDDVATGSVPLSAGVKVTYVQSGDLATNVQKVS